MDCLPVVCPTCFETFEVALPAPGEMPCEIDYDCEICCNPMTIVFEEEEPGGPVSAYAKGLAE